MINRYPHTWRAPKQSAKDTVPALLSPGEMVLNNRQQSAVQPVPGMEGMLRPEQLQRMRMMTGTRPQHFWQGGITGGPIYGGGQNLDGGPGPVFQGGGQTLGGGPGPTPMPGQQNIDPRPMPTPFDGRAPQVSAFPFGGDTGGTPGLGMPPTLRQPMQLPPHTRGFSGGGIVDAQKKRDIAAGVDPDLVDKVYRASQDSAERDFDPKTEIEYQFRDKLGTPVQHFAGGGNAVGNGGANYPDQWGNTFNNYWEPPEQNVPPGYYYDNYGHLVNVDTLSRYGAPAGPGEGTYSPQSGDSLPPPADYVDPISGSNYGQMDYYDPSYQYGTGGSMSSYDPSYQYGVGGNMSPYDPSFPYGQPSAPGSGGPTRSFMGVIGSLLGGAAGSLIPGGSIIGSKLGGMGAKAFTQWLQNRGASGRGGGPGGNGGFQMPNTPSGYDPFGGLPPGFNESHRFEGGAPLFTGPGDFGPNFTGDSLFNANSGPFRGGAFFTPPGGSIGGPLGTGSHGDMPEGYFSNLVMRRLLSGGDTSLGFEGMPNANTTAGAPVLPMSQWGGANQGGGATIKGPNQRQMNQR